MNEKPVIIVTGKVPNMQSWYEEKCKRALEELAHLSDTIHRPGDTPNRGWATKEEEIKTHLFNATRLVLILANVSCGQRKSVGSEDVGRIVDEGFTGYEKVWEKLAE